MEWHKLHVQDLNGNLTSDGASTYNWNARNQLTSITGTMTANFGYDGTARRRTKTVSGVSTQFLYDGLNAVQEQAGGTPTANLLVGLGLDETFTRTAGGATSTLLADALGSTVALADTLGAVQTSYTYEPLGATTVTGAANANPVQFTGRERDEGSIYFYRARHYDGRLGRFIAEDPLGFRGGDTNLHAYVLNNPVDRTDPLGLATNYLPIPILVKYDADRDGFGWIPPATESGPGINPKPIDGVCVPGGPGGSRWYKVLDGQNVIVTKNGPVRIGGGNWWDVIPSFPDFAIFNSLPGWKAEPAWSGRNGGWLFPPGDPSRNSETSKSPSGGRYDPLPAQCGH